MMQSTILKPYSMMIGRFQPFHDGHLWLVREILNENPSNRVWGAVRDTPVSENNPMFTFDVIKLISNTLRERLTSKDFKRCIVSMIPDIEGVHYGRGVGYRIVEHVPPEEIREISATKIRAELGKI